MTKMTAKDFKNITIPKEVIDEVLKNKAQEVVADIKMVTDKAISAFYADYTPITHKNRKLDYHNVWGIRRPYDYTITKLPSGNGYRVEFTYSSDFVTGHKNPDVVFNGPFMEGYHGGPIRKGVPAPQMSPSPWEMILDYVNSKYM